MSDRHTINSTEIVPLQLEANVVPIPGSDLRPLVAAAVRGAGQLMAGVFEPTQPAPQVHLGPDSELRSAAQSRTNLQRRIGS